MAPNPGTALHQYHYRKKKEDTTDSSLGITLCMHAMITTDCLQVLCPHLDLHTILSLLWTSQGVRSQSKEIQPRIHDRVLFQLHEPSLPSLWKHIQLESISIQFQTYAKCGVWSPHTLLMAFSCHKVIYIWSKVTNQLVSTLTGHLNDI
jgi:hypothetical protein